MLTTPSWRIAGVSVEGTSHKMRQSGCQDAHEYRRIFDEVIVLAVADGAGSARLAELGATTAVRLTCSLIEEALAKAIPTSEKQWQEMFSGLLEAVHCTLVEMASQLTLPPPSQDQEVLDDPESPAPSAGDLATTLTVVVITPEWVAAASVGDGAVVCQVCTAVASEEILTVLAPDNGEYINETVFLTDQDYLSRAQYACLTQRCVRGIALLTDGVTVLGLEDATGRAHAPFFTPLFTFVSQADEDTLESELTAFLQLPRVCALTGDDKTMVLAVSALTEQEGQESEARSQSEEK